MRNSEPPFIKTRASVDRAVERLIGDIRRAQRRYVDVVAPADVTEYAMQVLSNELAGLMNDPAYATTAGPVSVRLSNALMDYRDARPEER